MTTLEALQLGLRHQQAGCLQEAEGVYRQILAQDQANPDALHLLGMVAFQAGRLAEAGNHIRRAIAVRPAIPQFHNNLGNVLSALGQLQEAILSFEHSAALAPDFSAARVNLANAMLSVGRAEEAIENFEKAADLQPQHPEAYVNWCGALKRLGRIEEAEAVCRKAIALAPTLAEAHSNLSVILTSLERYEEAETACRRAIQLKPELAEAWCNLSSVLHHRGQFPAAETAARQALCLKPDHPESLNNLGNALQDNGHIEEAIDCYRHALQVQPDYPDALKNLGNALTAQQQLAEAISAYDQALALKPDHPGVRLNRAMALLLSGNFREGWREYEWRWKNKQYYTRHFSQPLWDGRDLTGKTILLHAEQGLGDTIQFVRYAPLVKTSGGRVVLECQPRLMPLLQPLAPEFGIDQLLPAGAPLPHFDVQAPLLSLPYLFRTTLETIPGTTPYLHVSPELTGKWRKRIEDYTTPEKPFRVGLVWAGNSQNPSDRTRSLDAHQLRFLAATPRVRFFNLQREAYTLPEELDAVSIEQSAGSILDTAAIVLNLHLVISVDTMVAHLAGALGVPVWNLLRYVPDWRWMTKGETTPWYSTMRLYRQARRGDWTSVLNQVREALGKHFSQDT